MLIANGIFKYLVVGIWCMAVEFNHDFKFVLDGSAVVENWMRCQSVLSFDLHAVYWKLFTSKIFQYTACTYMIQSEPSKLGLKNGLVFCSNLCTADKRLSSYMPYTEDSLVELFRFINLLSSRVLSLGLSVIYICLGLIFGDTKTFLN